MQEQNSVGDLEGVFQEQLKSFFLSPKEITGCLKEADETIKDKEELLKTLERSGRSLLPKWSHEDLLALLPEKPIYKDLCRVRVRRFLEDRQITAAASSIGSLFRCRKSLNGKACRDKREI